MNIINSPYVHAVCDEYYDLDSVNLLADYCQKLLNDNMMDKSYHFNSKKVAQHQINKFPESIQKVVKDLIESAKKDTSKFLGMENSELLSDLDHNTGGGFHCLPPGGFLNMHVDFNFHPITKQKRVANAILYLNKNWGSKDGGELELHSHESNGDKKTYLPKFNRLVIFPVNNNSWHGNPNKVAGNKYRFSY